MRQEIEQYNEEYISTGRHWLSVADRCVLDRGHEVLKNVFPTCDVNWGPWSDRMSSGSPQKQNTSHKRRTSATWRAEWNDKTGMNQNSFKKQSTITRIHFGLFTVVTQQPGVWQCVSRAGGATCLQADPCRSWSVPTWSKTTYVHRESHV